MTTRTAIPDPVVKHLYAHSGNLCAFPGCLQELTMAPAPGEPPVNVGKIAHIVGHSRQGPRGDADLSEAQRLKVENLLLLCGVHHDLVDDLPRIYSIAVLRKMKLDHESRHGGQKTTPPPVEMVVEPADLSVMPITALPAVVFRAPTQCNTTAEVAEGIRPPKGAGEVVPFVHLANEVLAFHDLSHGRGPFADVVDPARSLSTTTDSLLGTRDGHNQFVWLLNRALGLTLWLRDVAYDKEHKRYFFLPTPETITRSVEQVTKLGRKTTRHVVRQRVRRGEKVDEWWHDVVNTSKDGGLSWSDPATLIRESSKNVQDDKPSVTADPGDPDLAYVVWTRYVIPSEHAAPAAGEHVRGRGAYAPTWFSRTTDGGATWEPARPIYDAGQQIESWGNQIVVLPDNAAFDGELVNVMQRGNPLGSKNAKGVREQLDVAVIRSPDKGESWSEPTVIDKLLNVRVRDPLTGRGVQVGIDAPDIAVDRTSGALYVVWHDGRFSDFQHNDVALSMSTDGGRSWSLPVKVNVTPPTGAVGSRQAFTPSVEVAADGTVGVSYYDFRNNGADTTEAEPLETDRFIVHCQVPSPTDPDGCADPDGWSETRITPTSFNLRNALRNSAGSFFLGDYVGLAARGNNFATVFPQSNSSTDRATVYYSSVP